MASQTNGSNTGEQDAARGSPNHSERRSAPSGTSPPDIQTLRAVWARLQLANQQLAASHKESCDAQDFLWSAIDALLSHCGIVDRRCMEYYKAYKSAGDERGSILSEMHKLATKNVALQEEVAKAEELTEATNRWAEELDALSNDLADKNVSLQQDLDQARERIRVLDNRTTELEVSSGELAGQNVAFQQDLGSARERNHILESRGAGVDPPSVDASGSKNKVIHELDTVDLKSPEVRIMELQAKLMAREGEFDNVVEGYKSALKNAFERISAAESKLEQFGGRETHLDNRETDSTISCVSNRASPSPGEGGRQKAEESKINAAHGRRKQPKRGKGRPRKLALTNPGSKDSLQLMDSGG